MSPSTEETGLAEIMVYELKKEPLCPTKRENIKNKEDDEDNEEDEEKETNKIEEIKKELVKENQQQDEENDGTNNKKVIDGDEKLKMRMRRRTNRNGNMNGVEIEGPKGTDLDFVPSLSFLVCVCVVVLFVVLFVTMNKKRKIAPRRSAPMNRLVFYRPHTHEF